mgnify:CR=1 FL=1
MAGLPRSEKTVDFVERWAAEGRQFHYIHAAGRDYEDMTAGLGLASL